MIWTAYWLNYANFSEKDAMYILIAGAVFVGLLLLIHFLMKRPTLNAKTARDCIDRKHKAALNRF